MKKRCRQRRKDVDKERRQGRKKRKKERWQTRKKIQTKMMIQGKKDVDKEADKMQTIRIKDVVVQGRRKDADKEDDLEKKMKRYRQRK